MTNLYPYITKIEAQTLEMILDSAQRTMGKTFIPNTYTFVWPIGDGDGPVGDMWEVFYAITDRNYMNGSAVQL